MTLKFVILQNLIKAYHRKSGKSKYDRKLTELDVGTTRIRSRVNGILVDKLYSHGLFQAWWECRTYYNLVLITLIQTCENKTVTKLTTQGCINMIISWLHQSCGNNLVTSLIVPSSLLQVVNNMFPQLGRGSANTTCQQFVNRLATACLQVCDSLCVFTRVNLWTRAPNDNS